MAPGSPMPSVSDRLIYGRGDEDLVEEDLEDSSQEDIPIAADERDENGKPLSMYYTLFKNMIIEVFTNETKLFSEEELRCFQEFSKMSYQAKYLLIRLSLRKTGKWHKIHKLNYQAELGNGTEISDAINELCKPTNTNMVDEVKKEEPEIIDLTMDEQGQRTKDSTESAPYDLRYFCEDDSSMTLRELLECLDISELKTLVKQTKVYKSGNSARFPMISQLELFASTQTTLKFTTSARESKQQANKSLKQTTLLFFGKGKMKTQGERLREMVMVMLGRCVRVNPAVFELFQLVNLVYFRNTQYSPTLLVPSLLSRAKKRAYPDYDFKRTADIWPSREILLAYAEALKVEACIDDIQSQSAESLKALRGRSTMSKTPARKYQTPSSPARSVAGSERGESSVRSGDGNEDKASSRLTSARLIKEIFESVYDQWKTLVAIKGDDSPRASGLERFEPGHVLTRVVCKGAEALGILKEYKYESEVLEALLAQRRWRRGRRGRWYERRALLLMKYFSSDDNATRRAMEGVIDALSDDDTHIIYRPKLERRLTRLEKMLKIPADECHTSEGNLETPAQVYVEGVRLDNATIALDKAGRVKKSEPPDEAKVKLIFWEHLSKGTVSTQAKDKKATVHPEKKKGKSVWRGRDGEEVHVEILALQHYEAQGFKGFHSEGQIIRTLFGILFWDILFLSIPGAFETPYQSAPLDIAEETFYYARKEKIDKRLFEIKSGKARQIVECVDDRHREKATWCVGVKWDAFERQDLIEIVDCLGGEVLEVICRLICEDYAGTGGGVPDLCVWNAEEGVCKFVEVKGPGDNLQENQKVWIDVLLRAGANVELCNVAEHGQSKAKSAKKGKATGKAKSRKSKVKAEPIDSDSDEEPVLESEEEADELDESQYSPTLHRTTGKKRAAEDESTLAESPSKPKPKQIPRKKRRLEPSE